MIQESVMPKQQVKRGQLKVFFGYAPGTGKTFSMLKEARQEKQTGRKVVVGFVDSHGRRETEQLLKGFERIQEKRCVYKGGITREFDLDVALVVHPDLILVDDLAHKNGTGCRNAKRYQDVRELLQAGIDVYTTVNVSDLESMADIMENILGQEEPERLPDSVFHKADELEVVDIDPRILLRRLSEGKVYRKSYMRQAYTMENLKVLREFALKKAANHIRREASREKSVTMDSVMSQEHIMVCLSTSPSNGKVIRAAARMAEAYQAKFTAVYVEKNEENRTSEDIMRLEQGRKLAEDFGANVVVLYGTNIMEQIAEYAKLAGVSKLVLGKSYTRRGLFFKRDGEELEELTRMLPNQEIYLIPDTHETKYRIRRQYLGVEWPKVTRDMGVLVGIMAAATIISLFLEWFHISEINTVTVYILGVLLIALITEKRTYSVIASAVCVMCFNFFFTEPKYSLLVSDPGYLITFAITFASGCITAVLAKNVKSYGREGARKAYRLEVLLETSRKLQAAADTKQIAHALGVQIVKLFKKEAIYYVGDPAKNGMVLEFSVDSEHPTHQLRDGDEAAVAAWSYKNNKHAGATTDTLPGAKGLYLAVRSGAEVFGVIGIYMEGQKLNTFDGSILSAMLNEAALAFEKEGNMRGKNVAMMQMKQAQLRADLLRGISHDLRTPLTAISGNAGILLNQSNDLSDDQKRKLYTDVYDDSVWLYNMVENLLSVTRIENGSMNLNIQPQMVEEVVTEALTHVRRRLDGRTILTEQKDELLMAMMDAKLMMQVILNIVDNAVKYTPPGSEIIVKSFLERISGQDKAIIEILDNGPGIPDSLKEKVFEMFFSGCQTLADSSRSMGVGLSLCRSIVDTHGGKLTVRDNIPHGTIFRIELNAFSVDYDVDGMTL